MSEVCLQLDLLDRLEAVGASPHPQQGGRAGLLGVHCTCRSYTQAQTLQSEATKYKASQEAVRYMRT